MTNDSSKIEHPVPLAVGATDPVQIEKPERRQLVDKEDTMLVAHLALCFPLAWVLPERWWPPIANAIASALAPFRRKDHRKTRDAIRSVFGARTPPVPPEMLPRRLHAMALIESMQHLRSYRPGGWAPQTDVIGSEHIDKALKEGKGAILWITDFIFSTLVTKIALNRAGYRLMHLSRPEHPMSKTKFGRRFLNPIVTRLERRYLDQRILIDDSQLTAGMRTLWRRLKSNGVISITVGNESRQTVQIPILDGHINLAKGAPKLAVASGAPLLPVSTLRRDDGGFVTTIGAPLEFSRDGLPDEVSERAMRRYVERLEPLLIEAPHLWYDWSELITLRPTL